MRQAAGEDRGEPGPRAGFEGSTWFRINAGRRHNADPRWLLPLICRYGHVGRNDIGAIRVAANESYFEVTQRATPGLHQGASPRDHRARRRRTGDRAGPAARGRGGRAFQAPANGSPTPKAEMASQKSREESLASPDLDKKSSFTEPFEPLSEIGLPRVGPNTSDRVCEQSRQAELVV